MNPIAFVGCHLNPDQWMCQPLPWWAECLYWGSLVSLAIGVAVIGLAARRKEHQ